MALLLPNRQTFKLPFSANAVGGFNPTQLPNLTIWVDPSNAASVTTGAGGISQINDLSGNGNNYTQAVAGQRPDYTGTINGLNIMTFVSANTDTLVCVNTTALGPSLTIASVHKSTGVPSAVGPFTADDVGAGQRIAQYRWDSATVPTTICFPGPVTVSGVGAPDISAAAHVFVSVLSSAATVTNYIDGTANGTSAVGALASGTPTTRIGVAASSGGQWNGSIAEIVVCNTALTTLQRQNLEAYLKAKWGTP